MASQPSIPPTRTQQIMAGLTRAAARLTMAIGVLVLLGWRLDIEVLKRLAPQFVAMNPITAICFVCGGLSLELLRKPKPEGIRRHAGLALAVLMTSVGAVKLGGYVFHHPVRMDAWLFAIDLEEVKFKIPNQMAPNTAFDVILLGLGLLTIDGRRRAFPLSYTFALLVIAEGLITITGYAYGVIELSRVSAVTVPMALHTALAFVVMGAGILCCRDDTPLQRMFELPGSNRLVAKRLFPAATLLVLLLGWLRVYGERKGYFDSAYGTALYSVSMVALFTALIWWTVNTLGKLEMARRAANSALNESKEEVEDSERHLQLIMSHVSELICSLDAEDRLLTMNDTSETVLGVSAKELLGKAFRELVHPEDWEETGRVLSSVKAGLLTSSVTNRCKRKDGTLVEVAWSFQWSGHHRNMFAVGRAGAGIESMRAWDTA